MEERTSVKPSSIKNEAASKGKKAYSKPELVEYGPVGRLTAATGSANGDAGQGMMT